MNSSFSQKVPFMQLAWDSTSLGDLKICPRRYQYSIAIGYTGKGESIHLTFGILYHSAIERFDHKRAEGALFEDALDFALDWLLKATWNRQLNRPWLSDDPNKNRLTLIRSVVWYLFTFKDDPAQTVILSNGKPAVELSFRMQSTYQTTWGEPIVLCGHLDRVAEFQGHTYIFDKKTTKFTLSPDYFTKYSPDNQISMYALAGKMVYSQPISGVVIDAVQIAVSFSRYGRFTVPRHQSTLEEWYQDLGYWLRQAEEFARASYWPMNDKSCFAYGGCPFRQVCTQAPAVRERWLEADFTKRVWDPLQTRGDI